MTLDYENPGAYEFLYAASSGTLKLGAKSAGRRIPVNFPSYSCSVIEELSERSKISYSQVASLMFEFGFEAFMQKVSEDNPKQHQELSEAINSRHLNMFGLDKVKINDPEKDLETAARTIAEAMARSGLTSIEE